MCCLYFQSFEFDLKGQPLKSSDEITLSVKDWERVGRNRWVFWVILLLVLPSNLQLFVLIHQIYS